MPAAIYTPAQEIHPPAQKHFNAGLDFPLVLLAPKEEKNFQTIEDVRTWIQQHRENLIKAGIEQGAILFRGFPINNAEDFDYFVKSWGFEQFPYVGGAAVRRVITGSVFTANESPADQLIPFHHELAQSTSFPGRLFFYCDTPPDQGGETPLCLSNMVYERMKAEFPEFIEEVTKKGVRYVRILPTEDDPTSAIGRGWKSTFQTESKEEAEAKATELGMTFEWLPSGDMKTISPLLSATRVDARTGKISWFNSIVAAFKGWKDSRNDNRKAVVFGDGGLIDSNVLERCMQIMDEIAVDFKWEKGDVIMVDNWTTMHGRRSFVGDRVVLASLWK